MNSTLQNLGQRFTSVAENSAPTRSAMKLTRLGTRRYEVGFDVGMWGTKLSAKLTPTREWYTQYG